MRKSLGLAEDTRVHFCVLALFSAVVLFLRLGLNGMANYDDCFYAQEAKEILTTGQWGVLHFNGKPFYANAPLFMWLEALAYKAFGVGVFAAKFPSALAGFGTVLLTYFLGRRLFDPWVGLIAGFILATSYPFVKYSRHAMQDVTLAFFITAALVFLWLAVKKDRRYFWLWGAAAAFAVLTKSAMGLAPLGVALVFFLLTRRFKSLRDPYFLGGAMLPLVTGVVWFWGQYSAGGGDFLAMQKFVVLEKIVGTNVKPWWDHLGFLKDLAVFYWPWLPFLILGLWSLAQDRFQDKDVPALVLAGALTAPVVLSCMNTRWMWYFLQAFPAFALAAAYGFRKLALSDGARETLLNYFLRTGVVAVFLLLILPIPLDRDRERDTRTLAPYVKHFAEEGVKVIALREDFYGLNNALLFFSDHAAEPLYRDVDSVRKEFAVPGRVLCVAHKGDLKEIGEKVKHWYPVKYSGDLVLISNQQLDTSRVVAQEGT